MSNTYHAKKKRKKKKKRKGGTASPSRMIFYQTFIWSSLFSVRGTTTTTTTTTKRLPLDRQRHFNTVINVYSLHYTWYIPPKLIHTPISNKITIANWSFSLIAKLQNMIF